MEAKWCFPSSNGGEKKGLNDSGIETFKDNPIKSLAREICQNSLDAVLKEKIAIVEFQTVSIDTYEFPDKEGFYDILNKCLDYSKNSKNPKTQSFFEQALEKMDNEKIQILRISDFNTTGLNGSDWDNLVNSSGASEKAEGKGGSFGIGKNAPFACSDLRTVFYSTLDLNGNERSKGVSRLISYKLKENEDHSDDLSQGTGYFGISNQYNIKHIDKMLKLDKSFKRASSGTDIFVAAFNMASENDFKASIISEVLDGFLMAIWQEKLEIRVNGYIINKSTLPHVINDYKNSLNENTIMCFDLLADKATEWYSLPIKLSGTLLLGNINFGFKLRFDGTNKVSMIRSSGMKILDRTNLCPSLRFVGLAIIEGDLLNSFLRNLENPSHNKWEPQRGDTPTAAKHLLRDIYNSLTEKLNDVAASTFNDEIDIEGAGDYLPDEIEPEGSNKTAQATPLKNINKIMDADVKLIERPTSVAHLETDEIGDDLQTSQDAQGTPISGEGYEGFDHHGSKIHGEGDRDPENVGINPEPGAVGEHLITVKSKDIRIFCINKTEKLYRLIFTPTVNSSKGYISIYKLAEQNEKMPIELISVRDEGLSFAKNNVGYFEFKENISCKVDIKITDEEYSTMEVKLYAYKS